jgi:hypothetical protein
MSLFRPTADGFARKLCAFAALSLAALALLATTAQASSGRYGWGWHPGGNPASEEVNAELAVCPGQTFSQPFTAFGDENFYTLVDGSEFNAGAEGWFLRRGAEVVEGTRPDGSSGGVLDLPRGAVAISPPVCVTLQYPTARAWVQTVDGSGGLSVGVYYAGVKHGAARAEHVALLGSEEDGAWGLSDPFAVKPELAGSEEGVREVRFVFANLGWHGDFRLSGLYVDPRMR